MKTPELLTRSKKLVHAKMTNVTFHILVIIYEPFFKTETALPI